MHANIIKNRGLTTRGTATHQGQDDYGHEKDDKQLDHGDKWNVNSAGDCDHADFYRDDDGHHVHGNDGGNETLKMC